MPATHVDDLAVRDFFRGEYRRLGETAAIVLGLHSNDRGLCAACGSAFPCARAVLANDNLELVAP